ncbi:MAG: hypothetical protein Lm2023SU_29010 [Serratia ureilytica]
MHSKTKVALNPRDDYATECASSIDGIDYDCRSHQRRLRSRIVNTGNVVAARQGERQQANNEGDGVKPEHGFPY